MIWIEKKLCKNFNLPPLFDRLKPRQKAKQRRLLDTSKSSKNARLLSTK